MLVTIDQVNNDDALTPAFFNSRFGELADAINGNIDTENLVDGAVTAEKLAANAVTSGKIEAQQAWQTPPYSNSWVDYDSTTYYGARYYKDSLGVVHLRGLIKSGTATAGTTMLTFPAGYRPGVQMIFETVSNDARAALTLHTDGTLKTRTGVNNTWVSLNGITFRAEN